MLAQYRRDLESQFRGEEIKNAIKKLRETYPTFRKYPAILDLVTLVQPGNRNYADKDEVLRILLVEIKRETMLFPLVNFMFWESLVNIFHRKCRNVPNPDELFARVQLDFFHTAIEYPLDRRPRKIDVNLILDTKKKVTSWQQEEAGYSGLHGNLDMACEACIPLSDFQESKIFPEEMEEYLLDLVYRKVITQQQYNLLLETKVYAKTNLKEWAKANSVAHATVRSQLARVEAAIRRFEKSRLGSNDYIGGSNASPENS